MHRLLKGFLVMILAVAALPLAMAQRAEGGEGRRMQGGGINRAPMPQIFEVVSVDSYSRTVRMRASDGTTSDVHVPEGVYELAKLKPGEKIQVNFLVPDSQNQKPAAANIWPVP